MHACRRLSPLLNGDPRPNKALHALLYSLPGMPCIYYGDELGMGMGLSSSSLGPNIAKPR